MWLTGMKPCRVEEVSAGGVRIGEHRGQVGGGWEGRCRRSPRPARRRAASPACRRRLARARTRAGRDRTATWASSKVTQRTSSGVEPVVFLQDAAEPEPGGLAVGAHADAACRQIAGSERSTSPRRSSAAFWKRAAMTTGSRTRSLPAARACRNVAIAISLTSKRCVADHRREGAADHRKVLDLQSAGSSNSALGVGVAADRGVSAAQREAESRASGSPPHAGTPRRSPRRR